MNNELQPTQADDRTTCQRLNEAGTPEGEPQSAVPQIWVGSWLDYNNAVLHGAWIDAARSAEDIRSDIERMLSMSPTTRQTGEVAEDWGIFDHDNFGPLRLGEAESIEHVAAIARGITEHGPAFAAWADYIDDEEQLGKFAEAYIGEYDTVHAYVEELIYEADYERILDERLPESIRSYVQINSVGLALDIELSGDVIARRVDRGTVWLFYRVD